MRFQPDSSLSANSSLWSREHINYIAQGPEGDEAWSTFVLDKSQGFTSPRVERLNDSIMTFVWAILGAQAQTRSAILGAGTSFDAQKQFLANVEDAISSLVDIHLAIDRYQSVLQNASSKVDYTFGTGLYMAPSDMRLHIGTVAGYNNQIIIAPVRSLLESPPTSTTLQYHPLSRLEKPGLWCHNKVTRHLRPHWLLPAIHPSRRKKRKIMKTKKTALVAAGVAFGIATLTLVLFLRR